MFYVTDKNHCELDVAIYGQVWFTTERKALACAKRLSKMYPSQRFGIGCVCSSSQFLNGNEVD